MVWPTSKSRLFSILFVILAIVLSGFIRIQSPSDRNIINLDATYHVLLTIEAQKESPWADHLLLPIVTLGGAENKWIPWGYSIPDRMGNYYYVSFPPLGYILPTLFFDTLNLQVNIFNLMVFNLTIHLLVTISVFLFTIRLLRVMSRIDSPAPLPPSLEIIPALSAITYVWTVQTFYSHGVIYWHHSPFQLVWIGQIWSLLVLVTSDLESPAWRRARLALFTCSIIGPAIEWTGYLTNFAVMGGLMWRAKQSDYRIFRRLILYLILCSVMAAIVVFGHFALRLDLLSIIDNVGERILWRSRKLFYRIPVLLQGYQISFQWLFYLFIFGVFFLFYLIKKTKNKEYVVYLVIMITIVSLFPVVENLILMDHASYYGFDRLKLLFPMLIVFSTLAYLVKGFWRWAVGMAWGVGIISNVWAITVTELRLGNETPFVTEMPNYPNSPVSAITPDLLDRNRDFVERLSHQLDKCSLVAQPWQVRGWVTLSLGRNVYELVRDRSALRELVIRKRACNGVLLEGIPIGNDQFQWTGAVRYDPASDSFIRMFD